MRGDKERSREQELKFENSKLKREVSALRKQLMRLDLDRHSYVKEIVEEHLAGQEVEISTQDMLESMKKTWKCRECGDGHLEIFPYKKMGESWYYRQCNSCPHRTGGQLYTPAVKGVMRDLSLPDQTRQFKKK